VWALASVVGDSAGSTLGGDGRTGTRVTDDDGAPRLDLRIDALTRRPSVVVAARQARPNLPRSGCPFCPGGLEAPAAYDTHWFANRWPAMPDERCEVVLYTPEHDAQFWTLGTAGARRVVDLWADRTAALGARDDVDYVLVFENRGPEVGATIVHPHGQIYAFEHIPPVPLEELVDGVLAPTHVAEELVVGRAGDWTAWVPEAAVHPYDLRLAPTTPIGSLTDESLVRDDLAALLVDSLARLDQLFDAPMPYMLWIHQRPTDGGSWPQARLHVHITPLLRGPGMQRFVAAAEIGAGVFFNTVAPEAAAAQLRALPGAP
jgi:UDPglucose--hexose-1-phosphate uridylyltransferase